EEDAEALQCIFEDQSKTEPTLERADDATQSEDRFEDVRLRDEIDEKVGFARFSEGPSREGWLVNMHPTLIKDDETPQGLAAVDYYFIQDDGGMFKATMVYEPYFYISCKSGTEATVEEYLMKKYEGVLHRTVRVKKEDLKMPNHLLGYRKLYLQLRFKNITDLLSVRKDLLPLALKNSQKMDAIDAYAEVVNATANMQVSIEDSWTAEAESSTSKSRNADPKELIVDIREYDVPYYLRVAIDNEIRVGLWYTVTASQGDVTLSLIKERVKRAEPVVMAYDIETTKLPLKFPDQALDQIMMISYMIDGQGFLITNREIVSEDIEDFEYTPKPEYEGPFTIFNEPDEAAVIRRWFEHIREAKPTVMATFNGDSFDFPFVDARAKANGIDMFLEIGFRKDSEDEYKSRSCAHMDCFRWVKRDSYLPQGSQGLKAVTTYKLGYNPTELDPELMTPYARDHPQLLAQYSVSDAVATYYLYMKYVHPFIFSLCNIIPLNPDEVLRKGSGTLCETLLMVEAYRVQVIFPNRHEEPHGSMFDGHLLASETYVGGHVEALEAGVFRSDIPTNFKIVPAAVQQLIDDLDAAMKFCIVEESHMELCMITNYDEIKAKVQTALEELRDNPNRFDRPLIYHLDVAAMYPNIMLSNRLQPDSVVDEATCAVCDYNRPGKTCDRRMKWAWRGEYFPAQRDEFNMVKHALQQEMFPGRRPTDPKRKFDDLTEAERTALMHKRLGDYSRKVYKKTKETKVVERTAIICQRENPFYIDTVRSFRDRRYEYKGLHKTWKKNLDVANEGGSVPEIDEAKKMIVLYDSLQLAHKCILNSFYGYVMRKGARWHSMEMAGITCLTGATIIQMARTLVEQIGRPLELDTDGIWCMLPGTFPEDFKFQTTKGKPLSMSYPCTMLNHLVHAQFTNHQYHDLVDPEQGTWAVHSENSIFFELDGPYKAMILPSSKEEDKLLKKRYAVFNDDGSLAELKGFEVKRRGELQLIKIFQSQIFERFLLGSTTEECYAAVATVADQWLDVLFSKAASMEDEELFDLIAENRSMSKTLAEYAGQKSTSISTAKRLAEFLGDQMVKDKGLACKFVISAKPMGAPVTERAVPVAIFSAEESVKRTYLRKWLKDNSLTNFDLRSILDWEYYIERLGSVIQKLITIPAAMQKVANPVPRIRHPDWLHRRVVALGDKFQQHKVTDFFKKVDKTDLDQDTEMVDIEDSAGSTARGNRPKTATVTKKAKAAPVQELPPVPNPSVDYSGYIRAMRPRWKANIEKRLGASTEEAVPAMFRGVKVRTTTSWDVVQIRPTNTPGRFIMWTYTDGAFTSVSLRIPREFYINLKIEPPADTFAPDYSVESVVRTLPRGHPILNLYKVVVPERMFLGSESHFADLLNHPNVDGVYELQVPLATRALLRIGSAAAIDSSSNMTFSKARNEGFELHHLERAPQSLSRRVYLDGGSSINHILLFHSATSPRHVFTLFYPNGSVKIHIVDPATRRQPLARVQETYSTLRIMREEQQREQEKEEGRAIPSLVEYPASIRFDVAYHGTEAIALRAVSRELGVAENRSTMLVISSCKEKSWFEAMVPRVDRFPVLLWSGSKSGHSLETFPWQTDVVRKMLSRYLGMGAWLYRVIHEAAYYDVPVGNIEGDEPLFYTDIDFARRLMKKDMVLWWSSSGKPDLGGREDDAYAFDDLVNPEINDTEKLKENAALEGFIARNLTRVMLRDVEKIGELHRHSMTQDVIPEEWRFPLLPGSHLPMSNAQLEFIKFTCAVFGLAKEFVNDVGVLRKNLLGVIGVREFSEEAAFKNPCEPFKLPMVICRVCSTMRDFDFCRDPDLLPRDASSRGMAGAIRWQCANCECDYDRRAIEAMLIDIVRKLVTSFQLQDLRCAKCKQIKSDNLTLHCHCSGADQLTSAKGEAKRKIRTISNVASVHGLALLKEPDSDGYWPIERIIQEKGKKFLVKWKGVDKASGKPWPNDWVNKTDCSESLIQGWEKEKADKKRKRQSRSSVGGRRKSASVSLPPPPPARSRLSTVTPKHKTKSSVTFSPVKERSFIEIDSDEDQSKSDDEPVVGPSSRKRRKVEVNGRAVAQHVTYTSTAKMKGKQVVKGRKRGGTDSESEQDEEPVPPTKQKVQRSAPPIFGPKSAQDRAKWKRQSVGSLQSPGSPMRGPRPSKISGRPMAR
ncbi:DNA polymerase epsilon catalytic subunit, partial [Tulasnella sp. 427]